MALGSDQSETALTREKEFSRCLLESMTDGVVACDADGILTLFNRSAREWHGLDPLRLPPDEWAQHYDLFRGDGITPLSTDEIPLARAFRGETVKDAEMAIKAKGQPIRFILANGSVIQDEAGQKLGAVVIMHDVTEFRRLEQELRKANEELEQRVEERTEELRKINQQLQSELAERAMMEKTLLLTQFSVDHAADGIMWIRPDGSYCYTNEAASRLLGYSAGEFLEMKTSDVNPAHPMEEWPLHWEVLKRTKTLFFEATLIRRDGSPVPVEIHANHVVFGDQEYNCASVRDISERKRMEDALFFVAQRGWLADAENFFDALAQYLGQKVAVDYVVIDRIDENPGIAETVALYARGAIVPNMRYALKGTPCENVMGRQLCVYPQNVQQQFPEDTLLAEMGVESYIGIPLWDPSGQPIGLIALMDSKPLTDAASVTQLLQLVAVRAAAELTRERSDRTLRKREHEFRTLANSLPDNIVRYDLKGRTIYVNPVLEKTLGAAAAEMIGKRVREIHPEGDYEAYAQALDATLASGENREFELILPISGKEPIVHHIRMIAEHDDHGEVTGVLAIGHDITERKVAEESLRKTAWDLNEAQRIAHLGSWELDLLTNHLSWSDEIYRIFEIDPRAFGASYDAFLQAVHPDEREAVDAAYTNSVRTRTPYAIDHRLLLPGGRIKHVHEQCETFYDNDRPIRSVGTVQDVTGQKLADEALRASEERYRMVFENSPVSIWEEDFSGVKAFFDGLKKEGVTDIEEYLDRHPDAVRHCAELAKIIDMNRAALVLRGAASKEALLGGLSETFTPESFETFREELVCFWNDGTEMVRDTVVKTLAGESRHVTAYVSVCPDYEGTLAKVIVSLADITARKQAEETVMALNEELEQRVIARTADLNQRGMELSESQQALMNIVEDLNEKTAELEQANAKLKEVDRLKSMFIASMSHELRTPLNSIIGFTSVVLNEWIGPINADQNENLAIVLRCGKHLLNLINDVIDVSKIEAGKIETAPEEFDLYELIDEAVSLVRKDAESKGLDLRVMAPHQQMRMDRRRLMQCVLNLLSNSMKFTEQGGVTVEARMLPASGEAPEAGVVEISVTDTGIGIREEDLPKMFRPFVRLASPLKTTVPGTGLGLYLTRKLTAEVLKGDMFVTSEYGKGSRFAIKIPVRIP